MEGFSGIGLVFGLMGGSLVFESMGIEAVFVTFGSLLPIMAVVSRVIFSCLERRESEEESIKAEQEAILLTDEQKEDGQLNSSAVQAEMESALDDDGFQRQAEAADAQESNNLSYFQLLKTPRVIFAALSAGLGNFVYSELEPILALRVKDFDATTIQAGMCLSIYGFVYIIGTLLVP